MKNAPSTQWQVAESAFPRKASSEEKLRFLVRYAILAPSSHNTQPWLFRVEHGRLSICADRRRRLPVVDPNDRALLISCGAALGVLRVAARYFCYAPIIELSADAGDGDCVATVELGSEHHPTEQDRRLFHAIPLRRSTRTPFADAALPLGLRERLLRLAATDDVQAVVITDAARKAELAKLIAQGDRIQFSNPSFRRELGSWVRSRRSATRDGISGSNFGMPDVLSAAGRLVIRTFDLGSGVAAKDEDIASHSPALVVIATRTDEPVDWLKCGMAHVTLLLEVTASGLTAAYLNQPIEVDELRPKVGIAISTDDVPQLLLRIGRGPHIVPAVRRPVSEVLIA